jgi:hypothetical protein
MNLIQQPPTLNVQGLYFNSPIPLVTSGRYSNAHVAYCRVRCGYTKRDTTESDQQPYGSDKINIFVHKTIQNTTMIGATACPL